MKVRRAFRSLVALPVIAALFAGLVPGLGVPVAGAACNSNGRYVAYYQSSGGYLFVLNGQFRITDGKVHVEWMDPHEIVAGPFTTTQVTWSGVINDGSSS